MTKQKYLSLITLTSLCQKQKLNVSKISTNIITKNTGVLKSHTRDIKKVDETLAITGGGLIVVGTIAGGLTLNPIILGVINGTGVIVASIAKMKNYKKKIEMSQIAFTTYEKVLVELRSALQGDDFNKQEFIDHMKLIDEMIMDQTPIADRFAKRYNKKCM